MKNYTSSVPYDRTILNIETKLVAAGARGITKEYKNGVVESLTFSILNPQTQYPVFVRLPANIGAVEVALASSKCPKNQIKAQALRTGWKLMQDWVEVQLSLIEMQQIELLQVFLPYVWNGEQSLYQSLKQNNFKALGHKPS